jgi:hypothetical protein
MGNLHVLLTAHLDHEPRSSRGESALIFFRNKVSGLTSAATRFMESFMFRALAGWGDPASKTDVDDETIGPMELESKVDDGVVRTIE